MAQPPAYEIDDSKIYRATITTDRGTMVADLDPKLAPNTVNHFVALARQGFYDGLTFHRVVPDFVIQGGDPDGSGTRRSRLQVGRRAGARRVHARRDGDGQRGAQHQRLAVLRVHRRLHAQAHQGLQPLRLRDRAGPWTSRWRRRWAT